MELITSPTVLFLDEPTTGLDSNTAYSVMLALERLSNIVYWYSVYPSCVYIVNQNNWSWITKCIYLLCRLTRKGKTIIFSIHQPRYSIFKFFNNLILLSQGECVFQGPANKALDYFQNIGISDEFWWIFHPQSVGYI